MPEISLNQFLCHFKDHSLSLFLNFIILSFPITAHQMQMEIEMRNQDEK
jgi:hypothetical protein